MNQDAFFAKMDALLFYLLLKQTRKVAEIMKGARVRGFTGKVVIAFNEIVKYNEKQGEVLYNENQYSSRIVKAGEIK